jgi:hypothetical protein
LPAFRLGKPRSGRKGKEQVTTATIKPAKQDKTTLALLFVAALVAVGGIGFAVGHLTAPAAASSSNGGSRGGNGANGGFARPSLAPGQTFNPGQFGGNGRNVTGGLTGGITGTVESIDGSTLTLKLANGSTITIDLSGTTTYHNETAGTASDVTAGSTVIVQIETGSSADQPNPGASGAPGAPNASGNPGRTLTAKDVIVTAP